MAQLEGKNPERMTNGDDVVKNISSMRRKDVEMEGFAMANEKNKECMSVKFDM